MLATINEGWKVKRIREILGIKQEALAAGLGVNQQKMSAIEQKEEIDEELMKQIAEVLKVPVEAIRNFDERSAINIVSSTLHDQSGSINYSPSFNPIDKLLESLVENKNLYERLLQSEKEKNELLQKMLKEK